MSKVNSMSMTQELSGPSRKAKHQIKQFDSLFPGRLTALGPESKKYESGLEVTVSQSQIYFSPLRFPAGFFTVPLGSGFPAGFFQCFWTLASQPASSQCFWTLAWVFWISCYSQANPSSALKLLPWTLPWNRADIRRLDSDEIDSDLTGNVQ